MFIPAGWTFSERALRAEDMYGIRMGFAHNKDIPALETINTWLLAANKQSSILQALLDYLKSR